MMTVMALLLLSVQTGDAIGAALPSHDIPRRDLMRHAGTRLSAACKGPDCGTEPTRSPFRLDDDDALDPDAKARAIGDDGSRCSVVGARVCTRKPRTLLRAELTN